MRAPQPAAQRDAAERLAIDILAFIASDMERLEPFLALTGLQPGELRAAAAEPGFLAGIIEYITNNENLLIKFAEESGVNPANIGRARDILAGPPPDWGA